MQGKEGGTVAFRAADTSSPFERVNDFPLNDLIGWIIW